MNIGQSFTGRKIIIICVLGFMKKKREMMGNHTHSVINPVPTLEEGEGDDGEPPSPSSSVGTGFITEYIICNIHVGMLSIFILGTSDDSHGTTHRAAHHIPMSQIGTALIDSLVFKANF
jgi:hypothetical protein